MSESLNEICEMLKFSKYRLDNFCLRSSLTDKEYKDLFSFSLKLLNLTREIEATNAWIKCRQERNE